MIAMLRYGYGSGMPHFRLEGLQASLYVPLPDATQWDIVRRAVPAPRAVFQALIKQAAHFPDKPIKLFVAFAPGTGSDAVARVMAAAMGKLLGQTLIVDNRSAAATCSAPLHAAHDAQDPVADCVGPAVEYWPDSYAAISVSTGDVATVGRKRDDQHAAVAAMSVRRHGAAYVAALRAITSRSRHTERAQRCTR